LADPIVRTRIAARILGPYLVIMGATLLSRLDSFALMLPAFMQDAPLVVATGAFTLMAGLTLFALHHHWTGPAPIVITACAVVMIIKGASLMLFPQMGAPLLAIIARAPPLLAAVGIVVAIVGGWLAFVGWTTKDKS
jgi:hypothetical protein